VLSLARTPSSRTDRGHSRRSLYPPLAALPTLPIVTVMVLMVFSVLALKGDIHPDNVMLTVSMVISFYFGTQHEKKL